MSISSRTPEGEPLSCPLCGLESRMEVSDPVGDAVCPACGHLLWRLRDQLEERGLTAAAQAVAQLLAGQRTLEELDSRLLPLDSLDTVELVMELEEEFDLNLPDAQVEDINSIGDVVRWLLRQQR